MKAGTVRSPAFSQVGQKGLFSAVQGTGLSDHPHCLRESPRRVEQGLLTPLATLSLPGAGPDWGGRSDLAGKEGRLCFQGWLSRPALENILSQLRALCCVVCFHGVWEEWWGGGGSCQACRKRFVEGDPSLMLALVMGCPMTPHPTLWLSRHWRGDG